MAMSSGGKTASEQAMLSQDIDAAGSMLCYIVIEQVWRIKDVER